MEKILIEIKGTQQYGRDTDVTELTTFGTIRDDGTAYIIKYKEERRADDKNGQQPFQSAHRKIQAPSLQLRHGIRRSADGRLRARYRGGYRKRAFSF